MRNHLTCLCVALVVTAAFSALGRTTQIPSTEDLEPGRMLARRVLNQFTAASFEQSMILIQTKKYHLAATNLATDAEAMPDNSRVLYNLACAYALDGDKRRSIEALNNSVRKGFSSASEIESNHQLDSIRNESGFKKILEGLKKQ